MLNRIRLYFAWKAMDKACEAFRAYQSVANRNWNWQTSNALRRDLTAKEKIVSDLINPANKVTI